jgi:hypothetical protein
VKKTLAAAAIVALATLGFAAAPAFATTPTASYDYDMDGAFTDSVGSSTLTAAPTCSSPAQSDLCNVSTNFGSDSNGNYFHWVTTQDNGGGVVLDTAAHLGATYSLYLKFAIEQAANDVNGNNCSTPEDNYSKLLDFRDQASDVGLYTSGCDPLFISTGYETGTAEIPLDDVVEIVISRDDSTGLVTFYLNYSNGYEESFVTDDSAGDFIPADQGSGSRIRLFQEDGTDGTAEGIKAGRLYGMKAFADTALTIDQLDGLVTVNNDLAETGFDAGQSSALLGFGIAAIVAGVAVVVRRRRA